MFGTANSYENLVERLRGSRRDQVNCLETTFALLEAATNKVRLGLNQLKEGDGPTPQAHLLHETIASLATDAERCAHLAGRLAMETEPTALPPPASEK